MLAQQESAALNKMYLSDQASPAAQEWRKHILCGAAPATSTSSSISTSYFRTLLTSQVALILILAHG